MNASVPGVPGNPIPGPPTGPFTPYGRPASPLFDFTPRRVYGGLPRSTGPWNEPGGYYGGNPYTEPPPGSHYTNPDFNFGLQPLDLSAGGGTSPITGPISGGYTPGPTGQVGQADGTGAGGNPGMSWSMWQDYLRQQERDAIVDPDTPDPSVSDFFDSNPQIYADYMAYLRAGGRNIGSFSDWLGNSKKQPDQIDPPPPPYDPGDGPVTGPLGPNPTVTLAPNQPAPYVPPGTHPPPSAPTPPKPVYPSKPKGGDELEKQRLLAMYLAK